MQTDPDTKTTTQSGLRGWLASGDVEPWRDWALLVLLNHGVLIAVAVISPSWPWLLLFALPLGVGLATATLTVLHDAGHKRLSRKHWLNVFATQTSAPVGLWVTHWTLKHRVHHRVTQVYPLDDATRSSGMIRLHPSAPRRPVHRYQQYYAWFLYGLAWVGELRSQVTWALTGELAGIESPPKAERIRSFLFEKACAGVVLAPYIWLIGPLRITFLLVVAMTLGSAFAGVVLVVGHINTGLRPTADAPAGRDAWAAHLVRTSASFSTNNRLTRWFTGGMTHHLAHHLRATAPRGEFPELQRTTVAEVVAKSGVAQTEYPSLRAAVRGHRRALAVLGTAEAHDVLNIGFLGPQGGSVATLTRVGADPAVEADPDGFVPQIGAPAGGALQPHTLHTT